MITLKFVALPDYVSSLTLLRLVIVIEINEITLKSNALPESRPIAKLELNSKKYS